MSGTSIIAQIFVPLIVDLSRLSLSDLRNLACEQQKHRPVCASTQSNQRLYYSHCVMYNAQNL